MPPPPAVIVDNEEEWEVERILDSRRHYNRLQYHVKWKGFDAPTWQPDYDMQHSTEAVREFHRLWPDRPRPLALTGAHDQGGGYCHGADLKGNSVALTVDRTPNLASPVTPSHRYTYGIGAMIFESMWSGQGCRRGSDRRGVGA